jgi:Transposase DDE domain group 1
MKKPPHRAIKLSVNNNFIGRGGGGVKQTECTVEQLSFQGVGKRQIVARFDGGQLSSDGGGLLLREVERQTGLLKQFAACFRDYRNPTMVEHSLKSLIRQRVMALALGYEDLNDHDQLRNDPLIATLVESDDPTRALAGKSTLNRLELTPEGSGEGRYKRIVYHTAAIDRFLVDVFLQAYTKAPERIVLDLDTTDDEIHGGQEGRFFHGYYRSYCYLPLYIFSGEHLLCARLRQANVGPAEGTVEELERIVTQIREQWPEVKIVIRADSAFSRDDIMSWCEEHGVDYVLGLARNARLERMIASEMEQARAESEGTGLPFRSYKDFEYQTLDSWSRTRRVVGKAEHLVDKPNARFVVTSLPIEEVAAQPLYENDYCGRGEMENRIKEQKSFLFSDRTSAATMRANQLRLWFSSVAYLMMSALRRLGLKDTDLAKAQCDTIRLKLFKIGARITVTARKIWISLSSSYPLADLFARVCRNLAHASP